MRKARKVWIKGLASKCMSNRLMSLRLMFDGFLSCLEREYDWARFMHFELVCN